jgi:hypothetical protein
MRFSMFFLGGEVSLLGDKKKEKKERELKLLQRIL